MTLNNGQLKQYIKNICVTICAQMNIKVLKTNIHTLTDQAYTVISITSIDFQ